MKKVVSMILACALLAGLCLSVAVGAEKDMSGAAQAISLPPALLAGHSYRFAVPPIGEDVSISVNGQPHTEAYVAEGSQAVVVYTDAAGEQIASYTLPVIDTKNSTDQCAYFCVQEGSLSLKQNENDITVSAGGDGKLTFANALNADNFGLRMELPEDGSNYGALLVTLTDAVDGRVSVTIRLDVTNKVITWGEQSAELDGSVQLGYKNRTCQVLDGDNALFRVTQDDLGNSFEGFNGGVYMTLAFEGVTGSSRVVLTRLCNQPLGHKGSGSQDITEPAIVLLSELYSTQSMGEEFHIPEFTAYDVLSPVVKTSVTVELPDGTKASEDFTISQYGRYKLAFRVEDSQGNIAKTNKQFFVNDDVAPELTVNSLEKTTYKLGDAVTIPAYTVTDNLNSCFVDVILLLPNAEIRLLTHDNNGQIVYSLTNEALYNKSFINNETSFKTEQVGNYILRYVAYDDQYNRCVQELSFTVE